MAKTKEVKKGIVYQETYKKGTVATNKEQIIGLIKAEGTIMHVSKAGEFDDGNEFITITLDFKKKKK
jgi:hypothetical protein